LSTVVPYTGQPTETISVALKGLARVPRHHPLAVRLRSRAAETHARQGNRAACIDLFVEARQVCKQLPDEMPSRFSTDSAEHTSLTLTLHAASSHAWLGDWTEVERHARTACGVDRWSPGRAALAQINLGLALAHLGSPDEAAERGKQALALGRGYGSLLQRARKLDAALRSRYPKVPGVVEFQARYEDLARSQP
jgi:hypothetical protein